MPVVLFTDSKSGFSLATAVNKKKMFAYSANISMDGNNNRVYGLRFFGQQKQQVLYIEQVALAHTLNNVYKNCFLLVFNGLSFHIATSTPIGSHIYIFRLKFLFHSNTNFLPFLDRDAGCDVVPCGLFNTWSDPSDW